MLAMLDMAVNSADGTSDLLADTSLFCCIFLPSARAASWSALRLIQHLPLHRPSRKRLPAGPVGSPPGGYHEPQHPQQGQHDHESQNSREEAVLCCCRA